MTAKRKKIILYKLYKQPNLNIPLTITCDKEDAVEHAQKLLQLAHKDHFKQWCELRNLSENDSKAWSTYYNKCVDIKDKKTYIIQKVKFELKDIAASLRMFSGCLTLGCSFNLKIEDEYLNYRLKLQSEASKLSKELQNAAEMLKEEVEQEENKEKTGETESPETYHEA